jgi:hypothetical protein
LYKKHLGNEKIMGGIVGIYAKMSVDAILRDRIFKAGQSTSFVQPSTTDVGLFDAGLLEKLLPLLEIPATRHLAMRALSNVTHHSGVEVRLSIALQTPVLTRIIKSNPSDLHTAEQAIATLSHSIFTVTNTDHQPTQKSLKALNMRETLATVCEVLRRPDPSPYLIDHAVSLLAAVTWRCAADCKACPSMITFLVAGLRASDITVRGTCLSGLMRLHAGEAESDRRIFDPNKFVACFQRGFPEHLQDVMVDYGMNRCDVITTIRTSSDYQNAMMKCAQDRNLHALGLTLAELIVRTEFSVSDGGFQNADSPYGQFEAVDVGLPFTRWLDSLPHCAKAIRAKGIPGEEMLANILELKHLIIKQRIPDAVAHAQRAIAQNPKDPHAYFYYAITLTADRELGLRSAKKGLRCRHITPFIRFQLLQRAVEHAGDMGITALHTSSSGDKEWEEGISFLMSASEDAKLYVEQAPPDIRHMLGVLYWHILLTMVIKGPELSKDLGELKESPHEKV